MAVVGACEKSITGSFAISNCSEGPPYTNIYSIIAWFRFIINDVLFIEYYVLLWYILFIVDVINAFITCLLTNMLLKPVGLTFILNLYRKMCT